MKTINVEIEGTTPLLMARFDVDDYQQAEESRKKGKKVLKIVDTSREAVAKRSAYFSSNGKELIIPSQVLYASILNASSWYKINKRSAKTILAGSIRITPEEISLGTKKYEIDTRPVVNRGRGRILCHRAKLNKWKAKFSIVYNEQMIPQGNLADIKLILEEAGQRIGIMSYRPQKSGWYGTFKVIKFDFD